MESTDVGVMPPLGFVPRKMHAMVIRGDREGDPERAMIHEEVPVPDIGPGEVLVYVMAAGVNFNGVWAARGQPVSVLKVTKQTFHVAGSDASGIVFKTGPGVTRWKVGDEVVIHCNQACLECPECHGHDPMACSAQRIWGYETNYGSFAQYTKVQAQQLLPKPKHLSWSDAASYGLTLFTVYRMLMTKARLKANDNVLVWGGAGGLGIFAVQLCRLAGANAIAVVSNAEKGELARAFGAVGTINRSDFAYAWKVGETKPEASHRVAETRRMGAAVREITGGADADIVLEHVGSQTFPASVLLAKRFGRIVICGATTGYDLAFDVRHLWMRQKEILGSHFANGYESAKANQLVIDRRIKPFVSKVYPFDETARAHNAMASNVHSGKLAIRIGAMS